MAQASHAGELHGLATVESIDGAKEFPRRRMPSAKLRSRPEPIACSRVNASHGKWQMELNETTMDTAASESTTEMAALVHAGHAVRQLLVHLKANPIHDMTLVDIDDLPLPKSTLINAFRLLIASEARLEQRGQLRKIGLLLAQFQALGGATEPVQSADIAEDPSASFIHAPTGVTVSNERFWLAAYREQEYLTQLFDMSARMAEGGHGMRPPETRGQCPEDAVPN